VDREAQLFGLAVPGGLVSTTGVAGLTLGGGFGWLTRKYGFTCDSLRSADIVTADGVPRRAGAEEEPDLFWAVRGGGGAAGVVTAFEVRARRVAAVRFGHLLFPAEETAQVLRNWRDAMRAAPEAVTSTVGLPPAFGGPAAPVIVTVCDAGDDPGALEPFRRLGTLLSDDVAAIPYQEVLEDAGELPPDWRPLVRNRMASDASDAMLDTIAARKPAMGNLYVELRSLGGAVARVAADATAFAHRDAEVMVLTALLGSPAEQDAVAAEFEGFWQALRPHTAGAYGNFLSRLDTDGVAAAFPAATRARLSAVAGTYDPDGLLRRVTSAVQAA
jgi:FAD/FMN-containing dehydrogenase